MSLQDLRAIAARQPPVLQVEVSLIMLKRLVLQPFCMDLQPVTMHVQQIGSSSAVVPI